MGSKHDSTSAPEAILLRERILDIDAYRDELRHPLGFLSKKERLERFGSTCVPIPVPLAVGETRADYERAFQAWLARDQRHLEVTGSAYVERRCRLAFAHIHVGIPGTVTGYKRKRPTEDYHRESSRPRPSDASDSARGRSPPRGNRTQNTTEWNDVHARSIDRRSKSRPREPESRSNRDHGDREDSRREGDSQAYKLGSNDCSKRRSKSRARSVDPRTFERVSAQDGGPSESSRYTRGKSIDPRRLGDTTKRESTLVSSATHMDPRLRGRAKSIDPNRASSRTDTMLAPALPSSTSKFQDLAVSSGPRDRGKSTDRNQRQRDASAPSTTDTDARATTSRASSGDNCKHTKSSREPDASREKNSSGSSRGSMHTVDTTMSSKSGSSSSSSSGITSSTTESGTSGRRSLHFPASCALQLPPATSSAPLEAVVAAYVACGCRPCLLKCTTHMAVHITKLEKSISGDRANRKPETTSSVVPSAPNSPPSSSIRELSRSVVDLTQYADPSSPQGKSSPCRITSLVLSRPSLDHIRRPLDTRASLITADPIEARLQDDYDEVNESVVANEQVLQSSTHRLRETPLSEIKEASRRQDENRELETLIVDEMNRRNTALALLVMYMWRRAPDELEKLLKSKDAKDVAHVQLSCHRRCAQLAMQLSKKRSALAEQRTSLDRHLESSSSASSGGREVAATGVTTTAAEDTRLATLAQLSEGLTKLEGEVADLVALRRREFRTLIQFDSHLRQLLRALVARAKAPTTAAVIPSR